MKMPRTVRVENAENGFVVEYTVEIPNPKKGYPDYKTKRKIAMSEAEVAKFVKEAFTSPDVRPRLNQRRNDNA